MAQKENSTRVPARADYDVGYGKPPAHTRFQKGQSGNPRGRPKGSKNKPPALNEERLKTIIMEEAYRTITVTDKGHSIKLSVAQAVMRSVALSAAKGQPRAQRLFTDLVAGTETANKALYDGYVKSALDYKHWWTEELERRQRHGINAPDPIPHPDHIEMDMRDGTVRIKGPMTPEQKIKWDHLRARKRECDVAIAEYRADLANESDEGVRKLIGKEIESERQLRAMIATVIPD